MSSKQMSSGTVSSKADNTSSKVKVEGLLFNHEVISKLQKQRELRQDKAQEIWMWTTVLKEEEFYKKIIKSNGVFNLGSYNVNSDSYFDVTMDDNFIFVNGERYDNIIKFTTNFPHAAVIVLYDSIRSGEVYSKMSSYYC